jgi:hypothetical protein
MVNLREFKKNKALKRDLRFLIAEFENIKSRLIKYKIYKEVSSIVESTNNGIFKYKKILEKIQDESK